jgi:uncharacterized PurR-regulated membrane protein YhhQ (DUF165 family)
VSRPLLPLTYLLVIFVTQAVCAALLWVARTSQGVAAAETLPLVVILFVGALFVSATYHLGQQLRGLGARAHRVTLGVAAATSLALAFAAPLPTTFVLAPLTAVALGELYRVAFRQHAPMLASMTVYVVCTLLANFTFDSFLELPLYGQLSVGTLFFGVTFTQRDRVHRFGRVHAYQMILAAALLNLALSVYIGIPLRFLLAGFLAILIAEVADTEVYQRFIERRWIVRVATSNAVSIPLDSAVFTAIAFAGTFSVAMMAEIIFADILAKTAVGLLAATRILRQETREVLPQHPPFQGAKR